ncbi:uncharacterized protein LOC117124643, partial [Anneissia japonica]|uniref:uncharacterized protein LOC117124643 n=1 Tax=Anneissia japonica TaxID=1529436 RepID=UPI00142571F1
MFYCFKVTPDQRDYLRFFWYEDNIFGKPIIEYRMCVHVFGNKPSPAVATYGLREIVKDADPDIREFVNKNFYVDDGLTSCEDATTAISLLQRTQAVLKNGGGIRLHKFASNSPEVVNAFPTEDIVKHVREFGLGNGDAPDQSSLGVIWNLKNDTFRFDVNLRDMPFTRRGILSLINGIFDPLGFLAPVLVRARVLLREMMESTNTWDEPLPLVFEQRWKSWKNSLSALKSLNIPRTYRKARPIDIISENLLVYCDASEQAVAAVVDLQTVTPVGTEVGFVIGKSRIAPKQGYTIPRLELCSAVLAVELAKTASTELDMSPTNIRYYSDSKVALGYISNTTKRFHTFVANRVNKITRFSTYQQWFYVASEKNPADQGTRCLDASRLSESVWLTGPRQPYTDEGRNSMFPLVEPQMDKEIRKEDICT